jgi:hypothetical protein
MKSKKLGFVVAAALLALALVAGGALAQPAAPGVQKITVLGQITKDATMGGYYIQGEKPPEVFRIVNQNPKVLENYVKSGKSVTVEARVVQGDNLAIEKIDGQTYLEAKTK